MSEITTPTLDLPKPPPSNGVQLKKLTDLHQTIIRMHHQGLRNKDIAAHFKLTDAWVSTVINTDLARVKSKELGEVADDKCTDMPKEIRKILPDAIEQLGAMVRGEYTKKIIPASVQLAAINSVMDRTDLPKRTISQVDGRGQFEDNGVSEMLERGRKYAAEKASQEVTVDEVNITVKRTKAVVNEAQGDDKEEREAIVIKGQSNEAAHGEDSGGQDERESQPSSGCK